MSGLSSNSPLYVTVDAAYSTQLPKSSFRSSFIVGVLLVNVSDPGTILDSLAVADLLDETAINGYLDALIGRNSPESLASAIISRLDPLEGGRGELLIALVEGLARDDLWDALADSVVNQPDLPPVLAYLALEVLEGTGRIEARPSLIELRGELDEELEEGFDLSLLSDQIEDDPNSLPLALDALSRIEPEIRVAIIEELTQGVGSRGVQLLLEGLALEDDFVTRSAAVAALETMGLISPTGREVEAVPKGLRIVSSAIGPIDGEGIGEIAFLIETGSRSSLVGFVCDVRSGIIKTDLREGLNPDEARQRFDQAVTRFGEDATGDAHEAALSLVLGSAWLRRNSLDAETRASMVAIFGPEFRPHPVFADLGEDSEGVYSEGVTSEDVRLIFNRRPGWIDRSELTSSLALEMALHDGTRPPDPALDPGPFRVLLEGRILGRIELYRRMLLWTALAWNESRPGEAHAAKRLEVEMSDPQNAVPGHPFLEALMIRSLCDAKLRLDGFAS